MARRGAARPGNRGVVRQVVATQGRAFRPRLADIAQGWARRGLSWYARDMSDRTSGDDAMARIERMSQQHDWLIRQRREVRRLLERAAYAVEIEDLARTRSAIRAAIEVLAI